MRERPVVKEENIAQILGSRIKMPLRALEFLPLGNDARSFSYRAVALNGESAFVKLRRMPIDEAALALTRFLFDSGIGQVVAPLPALDGTLWQPAGEFGVIVYPFIEGVCAMEVGLSLEQRTAFGAALKRIHAAALPSEIADRLRRETFLPSWSAMVGRVQARVDQGGFSRPSEERLAAIWRERNEEIAGIAGRAEALGAALCRNPPPFHVCHADIHTANLLVDPAGGLHIVDWDEPLFAPKERDLMFIDASIPAEEEAFYAGYGKTDPDPLVMAYYSYEWVVQELGDYGERVFFRPDLGEMSAEESVSMFRELFAPGDVVESAYRADVLLPPELSICG